MSSDDALVEKKVIYAGSKSVVFVPGTRVKFHYQTKKCNAEKTLLDDSKKMGPGSAMELVLGKKFKLEVWEAIVQKMALHEVAQFTVNQALVSQYPFISKTLRDVHLHKEERTHTCAMSLQKEGLGYDDLNELLKNPCDLEFTLELIDVQQPTEYQKENWQMSEDERLERIPQLKKLGNEQFQQKHYHQAADFYAEAIGLIEQLQLKEKPHDVEWNSYAQQQIPYLLNFAQCKLHEGDFYAVIEHCTSVLKTEPENTKALYRRAKGHVGAWNPDQARADFTRVMELDSSLTALIKKDLSTLDEMITAKNSDDKAKYKNLFS